MSPYVQPSIFTLAACYNFARVVCISLHEAKKATARKHLVFSLKSALNFHYAKQNKSSSPTLPTNNDIYMLQNREYERLLQFYGYALQFQDTLQRGWLKNSNRAQIAPVRRHSRHRKSRLGRNKLQRGWLKHGNRVQLHRQSGHRVSQLNLVCTAILCCSAYCCHSFCKLLLCAGVVGIRCHVSKVLQWQLNIVCAAVLGRSQLLLTATTASACAMLLGLTHNAVHSSSTKLARCP